jgi:tetratricopeptide (TPR) repeat protein
LHQSGNLSEAENLYKEILKESPDNSSVLNLLGLLKIQNKQPAEAISYIEKAAEITPCAYFYESLGRAYFAQGDLENSIESYQKALEFDKTDFDIWFNLALAYKKNQQLDKTLDAYHNALKIKPNDSSTCFNLGNTYESLNETFKAIEYYEKAYEYTDNKEDADINYFLSVCYLKAKNFKKGLKHHEYRPSKPFAIFSQAKEYKTLIETKPLWDGTPMKDKTLLVYYESALGDTLLYLRYLKLLKGKFAKVLFKPQYCFVDLVKENDFDVEIIDNRTLAQDVYFDTHIPLMSLPYVLNLNTEQDIPFTEGYIKANEDKIKKYKEKYFDNDKFKIGFKWMGNIANDLTRVISIESFYKLFELPDTQFYSLQKGEGEEELKKIPQKYNVINIAPIFKDFSDTAAAIANLDLVICNDTSIAHLAGAMGKPCWIVLPYVQNWRWHTDISYCTWYKSVKLFKQIEPNNWDEVFDRVYGVF